jgi:hypothetical protein
MSRKLKPLLPAPKYSLAELTEIFDRRPGARAEAERRGKASQGVMTRVLKGQAKSDRLHRVACKLADELVADERRVAALEARQRAKEATAAAESEAVA